MNASIAVLLLSVVTGVFSYSSFSEVSSFIVLDLGTVLDFAGTENDVYMRSSDACGDSTSIAFDGTDYEIVAIGSQCWFAENLQSTHFTNGELIPDGLTGAQWTSTTGPATTFYNTDPAMLEMYGRLYNWYAVSDPRGLCPTGWHVPSEADWQELVDSFMRSTKAGIFLKSAPGDEPAWNGTNKRGFNGLPGGWRFSAIGNYGMAGERGYWWSSTDGEKGRARFMSLNGEKETVLINSGFYRLGYSVRCLRD